jgi:hypothetical protein
MVLPLPDEAWKLASQLDLQGPLDIALPAIADRAAQQMARGCGCFISDIYHS